MSYADERRNMRNDERTIHAARFDREFDNAIRVRAAGYENDHAPTAES